MLDLFLSWVSFVYAGGSSLDPGLVELRRVRLATAEPVRALKRGAQRIVGAQGADRVRGAAGARTIDQADLPAPTVAALRLADCLSGEQPRWPTPLFALLRQHFDEGQILELGAALTVASGWQRMIEAFGIRPDAWSEGAPVPWKR